MFYDEARVLVETHKTTIRKVTKEMNRRNKLSGEKVTQLMEKHRWTDGPVTGPEVLARTPTLEP